MNFWIVFLYYGLRRVIGQVNLKKTAGRTKRPVLKRIDRRNAEHPEKYEQSQEQNFNHLIPPFRLNMNVPFEKKDRKSA